MYKFSFSIYLSFLYFVFQDIGLSKDLNETFRQHLVKSNEPLDIDFSIQVLSSGSWPFQQSFTFSLPTEVSTLLFIYIFTQIFMLTMFKYLLTFLLQLCECI